MNKPGTPPEMVALSRKDQAANEGEAKRPTRRSRLPFVLVAVAAALLVVGIVPRLRASRALTNQVAAQHAPSVTVVTPGTAPASQTLLLPGSVSAYADASIYARTSGYIEKWLVDIGARVKAGQTLAIIQSPEQDAQLQQARADAATAKANFEYASSTAKRWQEMLKTQSVSQQDADTKTSDMEAKRAMLASAQANVARLAQLVAYEKVTAPFDGVITARNVDVGSLVTAGGTPGLGATTGELFHISQTTTLRIFVDVPQDDAAFVTPGTPVYLTTQQYPGRNFNARVARTAGAIDPVSRTLHVEIDVDNADGALMPGAYAQAHLALQSTQPALDLPVSALLFRPDGVTVAVVTPANTIALKTVTIGRDFGTHVEIATGLAPSDRVVDNPGDSITRGEAVTIVKKAVPADTSTSAQS